MDVDKKIGSNLVLEMEEKVRIDEEDSLERGLFIPLLKNETKQDRAKRILAMMEESNERLSHMLDIFNRMNR